MSSGGGLLFLFAVAAVILLSGYWLNALSPVGTFAERLALAALAGLATLILITAAVNFFLPLSGVAAWICLLPAAISLLWPRTRDPLLADLRSLGGSRSGRIALALASVFLACLLGPALKDRQAVFYDGTINHDSFIWITSAEFLQQHTYLETPEQIRDRPWMNMADDNLGLKPRRGQLGTEALLALSSSLAATTPLHTCLYLAAALFLPWCAAVYLTVITFYRASFSRASLAVLVLLQPVFVFFHANSNLPNLLGAITGAMVVVATEQALRSVVPRSRLGWCVLLALGFHGLLTSYPEMIPFVLLPCGLLWLRPWATRRWETVRTNGVWVVVAFLVGGVINPAITVRAWHGFFFAFGTARADVIFANLFEPLTAAEYLPGFATLSVPAADQLDTVLGVALTLILLATAATGWWRARDRWGALCTLAGSGALVVYTLTTGFNYGWQKSVQFGAVFIVALVTAPLLDAQFENWRRAGWWRPAAGIGLAGILTFYTSATVLNFQHIRNWSRQKMLSADWYELRRLSGTILREQPVLVEAASFRLPFFHSMWSAYFLSSSRIYFARRGGEGGGYLRNETLDESALPEGRSPTALLVGRRWAESFDANSPRLLAGREYVLFRTANRVTRLQGVYPLNGIPEHATTRFSIEIVPHSASRLSLTLLPYHKSLWPEATWRIIHRTASGLETVREQDGPPPWQIDVALVPGLSQTINCEVLNPATTAEELPFAISQLTVASIP